MAQKNQCRFLATVMQNRNFFNNLSCVGASDVYDSSNAHVMREQQSFFKLRSPLARLETTAKARLLFLRVFTAGVSTLAATATAAAAAAVSRGRRAACEIFACSLRSMMRALFWPNGGDRRRVLKLFTSVFVVDFNTNARSFIVLIHKSYDIII